jgi:uncharacterized protein
VTYLDTSVLGAIFFREPNAAAVLDHVKAASVFGLAISSWILTEMASVGAIKERTGVIDHATRCQALDKFDHFVASSVLVEEVEPNDFRVAATMIAGPGALRAGDALHLAIARRLGADLATLDRRLAKAAPLHGIALIAVE